MESNTIPNNNNSNNNNTNTTNISTGKRKMEELVQEQQLIQEQINKSNNGIWGILLPIHKIYSHYKLIGNSITFTSNQNCIDYTMSKISITKKYPILANMNNYIIRVQNIGNSTILVDRIQVEKDKLMEIKNGSIIQLGEMEFKFIDMKIGIKRISNIIDKKYLKLEEVGQG